jgi:hypothetical protein
VRLEADEALWTKVRGFGKRVWPVVLVHHDHPVLHDYADHGESLMGLTDYTLRRIWLDASRSVASIRSTLHHEIHHAVLFDSLPGSVLRLKCSVEIEEAMVRDVSPALLRALRPTFPPFPPEAVAVIRAARRRRRRDA